MLTQIAAILLHYQLLLKSVKRHVHMVAAFPSAVYDNTQGLSMSPGAPPWQGRSIASSKLRMLEFSAFLEQPQDPETVSKVDPSVV